MFQLDNFGPTKRLTMGRSFFGKTFYHCHAYLIDGLLIDTGCPCILRRFQEFLDNETVTQAAVTHYHEDHAGNIISLNLSGIPVLAPTSSLDRIQRGVVNQKNALQPYGLAVWGKSYGGKSDPLPAVIETDQYRFEVIALPGHSDDMHVFFERKQGWLFSGDLFIAARKSYWRQEENPLETIEALKKALRLDFETLFCGHTPTLTGGHDALKQKLEYMEEIHSQALKLHAGGATLFEITKKVLGGEGLWTLATLGDFSRHHFIEGLLPNQPTR